MTRDEIFVDVTNKIVSSLQNNVLPWRKPWGDEQRDLTTTQALVLPRNAKTEKMYQGVNIPLLWMAGYSSPYWATEKVWNKMLAVIKDDETPVTIYFSSFGRNRKPFLKDYKVYNLGQVYGVDYLRISNLANLQDFTPVEELIKATGVTIRDNPQISCYEVASDVIKCPPRQYFASDSGYYTTQLHEMVHWTGNHKRLNRVFGFDKSTPEYAVEELIAELGTCFVAAALEIPERMVEMPNHTNYIGEWLNQLHNDKQAFFRAASLAQKAANYLLKYIVESGKKNQSIF